MIAGGSIALMTRTVHQHRSSPHTCRCGSKFQVKDSRPQKHHIRRIRRCPDCNARVTTTEVVVPRGENNHETYLNRVRLEEAIRHAH